MSEAHHHSAETLFAGPIGKEYDMLKRVCPAAATISQRVADFVAGWTSPLDGQPLSAVEIGCGTGITSAALLQSRDDLILQALDNEPTMLDQARVNLARWVEAGRIELRETDALSGLRALADASVDLVASGYALHNFLQGYRRAVITEIRRVLRPGGLFLNGDRYALDDTREHTRLTQEEVAHWFRVFTDMGRTDLLEHWVVHLFSDESPDHIMRLTPALENLREAGFDRVDIHYREGVNALVSAVKPH
ncbi:class I SAM-dependent methyltransferase [Methyloterricola oryzae]|uniref:class I SAM-dependent methyltransferase n=1 Tax=Methyloterricola oryzae TaxID=1495050 RepID=UPI0005EBBC57|nr:class I SAM-dependent methyltransferase [Methyloterricola oryzae]